MKIIKKVLLIFASVSFSLLLFLSFAIAPSYYLNGSDITPFFDLQNHHPVITHPQIQITNIVGALLAPLLGSLLVFFLTEKKKSVITYLPILVIIPLYAILLYLRLQGTLML